jgi:ankyrin repeat protein
MRRLIAFVSLFALLATTAARAEVEWPPKKTPAWRQFQKLIRAADRNDVDAVRVILQSGADPDGKNAGDDFAPAERPLLRAARNGNLVLVDMLLRAGAMPDWCCCSCVTALHQAIRHRHRRVVKRLLDAGADPKIPYDGEKPTLELARATGDPQILALVSRKLGEE